MPESIESFKFGPHRGRMSGEFKSSQDSHSTKFNKNLNEIQIYLVYILSIMWLFYSFKKRSKSVLSNDNIHTTRSSHRDTILFNALVLKLLLYFYLLIEKFLVATSKFGLYSQGDRSGLSKPKW